MTRAEVKAKAADGLLKAAADKGVGLAQAAGAAGLEIATFAQHGITLASLLRAIDRMFDAAATAGSPDAEADQPARERLFDAIMRRIEAMEPHKPAILAIRAMEHADPGARAALAGQRLASALWLLEAAGVPVLGLKGAARAAGLARVLAKAEAAWREDGPDFTRTMAALDGALRDAEAWDGRLRAFATWPRPRSA
jgi:hypothetical protein